MTEISFTYLNGPDIAALEMGDQEILDAVEAGLRAQGESQTVIEPRVHLDPDPAFRGHFIVLRVVRLLCIFVLRRYRLTPDLPPPP